MCSILQQYRFFFLSLIDTYNASRPLIFIIVNKKKKLLDITYKFRAAGPTFKERVNENKIGKKQFAYISFS